MSYAKFKKSELTTLGDFMLLVLSKLRLVDVRRDVGEDGAYVQCNNLTLINMVLLKIGPTHERTLTTIMLILQLACSVLALFIRYYVSTFFYDSPQAMNCT